MAPERSEDLFKLWHVDAASIARLHPVQNQDFRVEGTRRDTDGHGLYNGECQNCLFPFWSCEKLPSYCEALAYHHGDSVRFYATRKNGCSLVAACLHYINDGIQSPEPQYNETIQSEEWLQLHLLWKTPSLSATFGVVNVSQYAALETIDSYNFRKHHFPNALDLFTLPNERAVGTLPWASLISGDTASSVSLNKALDWLAECSQTHKSCGQSSYGHSRLRQEFRRLAATNTDDVESLDSDPESWTEINEDGSEVPEQKPFNPRRLIDVGSQDHVSIVEITTSLPVFYVCLSHCWGKAASSCITTRANIGTLREPRRIKIQDLPTTFRHAVEMTRQLKLRYLWIDSLCILQDDKRDWHSQASQMADIFENAHLTLAAGWAPDDQGGLYSKASDRHLAKQHQFSHSSPDDVNIRVHMWHPYEKLPTSNEIPMALLTRAWVWQERILSKRVLYFGAHELLWECHEAKHCECDSWSPDSDSLFTKSHFAALRTKSLPEIQAYWRAMVESYSALNLTYASDRLPALSGLAKVFRSLLDDEYLAGLWRSSLASDLAWRTLKFPSQARLNASAPTFSWASASGAVYWLDWDCSHFEVLDASVAAIGADSTGGIAAGVLTILGLLLPVRLHAFGNLTAETVDAARPVEEIDFFAMHDQVYDTIVCPSVMFHPDIKFWTDARDFLGTLDDDCFCFVLGSGTTYGSVPALLLKRVEAEDEDEVSEYDIPKYQRVGILHLNVPRQDKGSWWPFEKERQCFQLV